MTWLSVIPICISLAALLVSIYFNSQTQHRSNKQTTDTEKDRAVADAVARASDMATINAKLDGISGDVRDIKDEIRNMKSEVSRLTERVVIVEQSAKSAHKRLDIIEGKTKED